MTDKDESAKSLLDRLDVSCGQCGSKRLVKSNEDDRFTYGKGEEAVELSVMVPVYSCEQCGFRFTTDTAEDLRHEAICNHLGVLTPNQIRGIRSSTGLTREKFASLTGLGTASLARWESGELIQTAGYDRYLRLMAYPDVRERLEADLKNHEHVRSVSRDVEHDDRKHRFKALSAAGLYEKRRIESSIFSLRPNRSH
jgi:putative zinc finger/helix-turn-helix YgiT family protein